MRSKEKSRNNSYRPRNRSYRASSIFSSANYSIPKRKRERQIKKKRRSSRLTVRFNNISDDENDQLWNAKVKRNNDDADSDEELLSLRLEALTSKQEVRELIEPPPPSKPESPILAISPVDSNLTVNEEEQLRIAALRSAVHKKMDHIKERKKLWKLENERPYSPNNFEPISFDDAMELSYSPLGSPFNQVLDEEVDMDISNSSPETQVLLEDNHEASDMEFSPLQKPIEELEEEPEDEVNDEELALRSMLLSSIGTKKRKEKEVEKEPIEPEEEESSPPLFIAKNLKMAVERIKQKKAKAQKSGNKTIKMILEENEQKKIAKKFNELIEKSSNSEKQTICEQDLSQDENSVISSDFRDTYDISSEHDIQVERPECILIEQIVTAPQEIYEKPRPSSVLFDTADNSFSTITDTKNIPLLPQEVKKKDGRLVTSLESVIKPVKPLIIALRTDSSDDEYTRYDRIKKIAAKKLAQKPKNEFEQNLDSFLKNIRISQEQKKRISAATPAASTSKSVLSKTNVNHASSLKTQSAVKHLPMSSQIEYENLVKKMQHLQEAKKERHKLRSLKRTKSSSSASGKINSVELAVVKDAAKEVEVEEPKQQQNAQKNRLEENLSKIPLLDDAARHRLIEKTETTFLIRT